MTKENLDDRIYSVKEPENKTVQEPTTPELINGEYFRSRIGKSVYAVIARGERTYSVAEIICEGRAVDPPNFEVDRNIAEHVLSKFKSSTKRN